MQLLLKMERTASRSRSRSRSASRGNIVPAGPPPFRPSGPAPRPQFQYTLAGQPNNRPVNLTTEPFRTVTNEVNPTGVPGDWISVCAGYILRDFDRVGIVREPCLSSQCFSLAKRNGVRVLICNRCGQNHLLPL